MKGIILASASVVIVVVSALVGPAFAAGCRGQDDRWTLADVPLLAKRDQLGGPSSNCAPADEGTECHVGVVRYVLRGASSGGEIVAYESRPIANGETLPFAITSTDSMKAAVQKIRTTGMGQVQLGVSAMHGNDIGASRPVSVLVNCGSSADGEYFLEFKFDDSGHIVSVDENAIMNEHIYTDDVTFHTQPAE